jgi:hypothetical protein
VAVQLEWEATRDMIADGLTKSLREAHFVRLLRMDQTERLGLIRREKELRDMLKARREAIQEVLEPEKEVGKKLSKGCDAKVPRSCQWLTYYLSTAGCRTYTIQLTVTQPCLIGHSDSYEPVAVRMANETETDGCVVLCRSCSLQRFLRLNGMYMYAFARRSMIS